MTLVKEKALTMIKTLTDENVEFIVKIMENLSKSNAADSSIEKRKAASKDLQQFRGRLKSNFDYQKELSEWRDERYGNSY